LSKELKVRDIMSRNIVAVSPDDGMEKVVQKMNQFRIGSILVAESGQPKGIITERDVLTKVVEKGRLARDIRAKEVMSTPVRTISEEASVESAAMEMVRNDIKRLVVTRNSAMSGVLTSTDILRAVAKGTLSHEIYIYLSDIFKKPPLSDSLTR